MRSATRFIRFLCVGGICAALNLAVLWFATDKLGLHYLLSTFISFATINALGFLLNKYFTFERATSAALPELTKYYATMLTSAIANFGLMYILVGVLSLHYLAASLVVIAILTFANFIVHADWTFGRSK